MCFSTLTENIKLLAFTHSHTGGRGCHAGYYLRIRRGNNSHTLRALIYSDTDVYTDT